MTNQNDIQTIWNFDQERMKLFDAQLTVCEAAFTRYDFKAIYELIRGIRRTLYAAIQEKEREEIEKKVNSLGTKYNLIGEKKVNLSQTGASQEYIKQEVSKLKADFYYDAEKLFLEMTALAQKYGMFFRKGSDPSRAIFRR